MRFAQSLKTKLVLLFVIITTVLLGLSSLAHYRHSKQRLESRLQMQLDAVSARLSQALPAAIWNFDPQLLHRTLVSEMSDPTIVGITVKDHTGKLSGVSRGADGGVVRVEAELTADIVRPVSLAYGAEDKKKQLGTAMVYASHAQIDAALRSDLGWEATQALVLQVVLVLALTQLLHSVVLRPLAQLRDALDDISSGQADLTRRLPTGTSVEFAAVSQGFNRFVAHLEGIVSRVLKQSETVAAGSQQIATGSHDLSSRTEAQANGLQRAASEVAALIDGIESNAKHAAQAFELVRGASDVAEQGGALVGNVVSTMRGISDSSKKIVDIIGVINGIAFQTNILALNAAVEAARAGEQGRGFAVVAAEVRGLASRCAEAAKEINSLIHNSVQEVETGCSHVETAGATMHQIVQSIRQVNAVVNQITEASREQSKAIAQVGLRLAQMDDVTQRNNTMAEETSAAASSLRDSASGLFQAVGMFKVHETQPIQQ